MTGGGQLVPISSRHEKPMLALSGLVHQISVDAAETAPTETTTPEAYLNRPGCRCTQYNIRPPSGPRGTCTTDTHQARYSGRVTVMLGYIAKHQ
jgi:hypothetical protein